MTFEYGPSHYRMSMHTPVARSTPAVGALVFGRMSTPRKWTAPRYSTEQPLNSAQLERPAHVVIQIAHLNHVDGTGSKSDRQKPRPGLATCAAVLV